MPTAVARPASSPQAWRPRRHRWTRAAYELAVEAGVFDPQGDELVGARVELLNGEIVTMPPQGPLHVTTVAAAAELLRAALAASGLAGYLVRVQAPLAADDWSEPEPDIAIVRGALWDFADQHPTHALLIMEMADSTVRRDRTRKLRTYARNGVPEYWLLNLQKRMLEVMRDPQGDTYRSRTLYGRSERVESVALPGLFIDVADLLRP